MGTSSGADATSLRLSSSLAIDTTESARASDDAAAVVSLSSSSETNKSSATADALRTLSDASSYIAIGQNALSSIEDLVSRLGDVYSQLQNTTNGEEERSLYLDAYRIQTEINSVMEDAQFNEESVFASGDQSFTFSLNAADAASQTSSGVVSLTIPEISISSDAFGPSNVGPAALGIALNASDGSGLAMLQEVQLSIDSAQSSLNSSASQLQSIANAYGLSVDTSETAVADGALEQTVESLTQKIVSNIGSALTGQSGKLDALKVADLLAPLDSPPLPADVQLDITKRDEKSSTGSLGTTTE